MNLVCSGLQFVRPELSDRSEIEGFLKMRGLGSCEDCFQNLFMWRDVYGTVFARVDGGLVFYNARDGVLFYPLGRDFCPSELAALVHGFEAAGKSVNFVYNLPEDYPAKYPEAAEFFRIEADTADFDYIYDVENQIALSGRKLRKKRNHIKHFRNTNPQWRVEPVSAANMSAVRSFMFAEDDLKELYLEEKALKACFDNFDTLSLAGLVLYTDTSATSIAAAAVVGAINADTFSVHFEKSHKAVEGAAQAVVVEEALLIKSLGGRYMNREQDLGFESLRHSKESLDPQIMYRRVRAYPHG